MEGVSTIIVGTGPLSTEDVIAVARHDAPVELSAEARARDRPRPATIIEALADDDQPHYGISTGFGALATRHIPVRRSAPSCSVS